MAFSPVVGTPQREYAEVFIPGGEALLDGELRMTVLGSGNPWPTRAQAFLQGVSMIFAELVEVYDGPVLQTQDLTVFNITKESVLSRQAIVSEQLPPIAGNQCCTFQPIAVEPPARWEQGLSRRYRRGITEIRSVRFGMTNQS